MERDYSGDKKKTDKQYMLKNYSTRLRDREGGILRDRKGPAANANVKAADDVVFFFSKSTMLYIRPQVI